MPCNVPDCDRAIWSRGVCSRHYNRWNKDNVEGTDALDPYVEASQNDGPSLSDHPLYSVWLGMKTRCSNPNQPSYKHYGARGVSVCDRWKESFKAFLGDVGERPSPDHTLDRIDVDGDYEPSNVRWATWTEQHRNRRNNRLDRGAVKQIRRDLKDGRSQREIAEEHGVSGAMISAINTGRVWRLDQ
jgi:hypothetical protein